MIDLKELEKEIDALLASETPESLKNWLKEERSKNIECYVGEGNFFNLYTDIDFTIETVPYEITITKESDLDISDSTIIEDQYSNAA